jgi:hypothetical protein
MFSETVIGDEVENLRDAIWILDSNINIRQAGRDCVRKSNLFAPCNK